MGKVENICDTGKMAIFRFSHPEKMAIFSICDVEKIVVYAKIYMRLNLCLKEKLIRN
jgi:hypothetical protein